MIHLVASAAALRAISPKEPLTVGMANAVKCSVTFDSSWDGLLKMAVFTNGRTTVDVSENRWDDDNVIPIPAEVLTSPRLTVRVGFYGVDGQTVVLPTVWCSLGVVQEAADPTGDESLTPSSPVWEQVLVRQSELEAAVEEQLLPYTTLTRDGTHATVTVHLHNLDPNETYAVHLYTANRRSGNCQKAWRHTPNFGFSDKGKNISRKGYARLAGRLCGDPANGVFYPPVPSWMPNGGYLQTEWPLMMGDSSLEIDLRQWLMPMLKPLDVEQADPWAECGLIGLDPSSNAGLLMRFCAVRARDGAVGESRDTLRVGVGDPENGGYLIGRESEADGKLYTSIV